MSGYSKYYFSTCIEFDLTDDTENTCHRIFSAFGKYRKLQLQFILEFTFPEYYKTGHIDGELAELIKKYRKDYTASVFKNPMFFGWLPQCSVQDKLTEDLLNKQLCGGTKDFIVYLLKTTYPRFFNCTSPIEAIDTSEATKETDENLKAELESTIQKADETVEDEDFLYTIRHQFDHMNISASVDN